MITAFLLFTLLLTLSAEHVQWQGDYEQARLQAVKEGKGIMVFLIQKNCDECMEMLRTTFRDHSYIKEINRRYVSVLITKDQRGSYPIELLYTLEYPSLFLLDAKEHYEHEALRGYATPETFQAYLEE